MPGLIIALLWHILAINAAPIQPRNPQLPAGLPDLGALAGLLPAGLPDLSTLAGLLPAGLPDLSALAGLLPAGPPDIGALASLLPTGLADPSALAGLLNGPLAASFGSSAASGAVANLLKNGNLGNMAKSFLPAIRVAKIEDLEPTLKGREGTKRQLIRFGPINLTGKGVSGCTVVSSI